VGTVYIAVSSAPGTAVRSLTLHGSRDEIRQETVARCLRLLLDILREEKL
jgi:nicotinamide mononucleotide (NMN) deamidase PncC